jgi:Sap-like sulfolipid-1-addressing protein
MNAADLFGQAAGLALAGACYPPALLIAGLYLTSERPGRTTVFFVLGGLIVVTVIGVGALILIRAGGLSHLGHHQPRYGLRLGLGVLALIAAAVIYRRKPQQPDPAEPAGAAKPAEPTGSAKPAGPAGAAELAGAAKPAKTKRPGLVARLTARPTPLTAFAVGAFMFGPSLTFISAVQVVGTARAGIGDTVGAMVMIILLTVAFGWLPLVAYLVAPERTIRALHKLEALLKRHGKTILTTAVAVVGVFLVIQGITGLT